MVPGRHAQFFLFFFGHKMNRSGQVRGGKRARGLCDCAKPSLPGYMVQFIYVEAVNLQFSPSSKGFDSLLCLHWLTPIFILPGRKLLKIAYCGLLRKTRRNTCELAPSQKVKQTAEELWKFDFKGKYSQRQTHCTVITQCTQYREYLVFSYCSKKCPPVNNPWQPWHPESCSYTPSNHLWFLVLTKKIHCLSWLCGAELPEMPWFICYVWLQFLVPEGPHSVTTVKAQLLFCSQRIWYPLFDRHSICGNCSLSLALCLSFLLSLDPSFCSIFLLKSKLFSKQKNLILSKRVLSCSAVSKLSAWLISFHFYMAFCPDKINGLSQV